MPPEVARPAYDRAATGIGVVHLGVGAFHRAHQAVYFDDRLAAGETDWAICGASLRAADTAEALDPQDGLYTLAVKSGGGEKLRVVGALRRLLVAPRDPEALLQALAHPGVRIVSLTVTEKGYCHDPATGLLNEDHPLIRADLMQPNAPQTAPGYLVEAIRRRRAAGLPPFTVLCCDNLPANGRTVGRVVSRLAELANPDLGRFVSGEVAFPSTMVDRIVPATTDEDRAAVAERLGAADAWPVSTEPFSQWVIEDRFSAGRPRLDEAGAELVCDVAPYEIMKLRLLNGSHSTLAYLGYLAGHETVADAIEIPAFRRLILGLMDEEITPTLRVPASADIAGYKRSLLARFENPALRHRTWQIAMDGSQKLPQRLLGTIRDRLAVGAPFPRLALGVAAWMRYVTGIDERGQPIDVRDPMRDRLRDAAKAGADDPEQLARTLLSLPEIFGDLAQDPRLADPVIAALRSLFARGASRTLEDWSDRIPL
ncbi:MAG TPA: mannitol dehydrogenase family protein [Microvirga sp.]|jgi:fructuronate reductase